MPSYRLNRPSALTTLLNKSMSDEEQIANCYEVTSEVEETILNSANPLLLIDTEPKVMDQTCNNTSEKGIAITGELNQSEIDKWASQLPIDDYPLNDDPSPKLIRKKPQQNLEYIQEIAVRYLRPPSLPEPGEIVIRQNQNEFAAQPPPPLIIRQQPPRPLTPEPLIIREAPPEPPTSVFPRKVTVISGKAGPPPPRKVIFERLPELPARPQSILIERWLPYKTPKRKVIYEQTSSNVVFAKPKNVIIQWEAPKAHIKREVKYLGIVRADPVEYSKRFGSELKQFNKLPNIVHEVKTPEGLKLATENNLNASLELEGDLSALKLIDLDKEGLGEYKEFLVKKGILKNQIPHPNSSFYAYSKTNTRQANSSNCSVGSLDDNDFNC